MGKSLLRSFTCGLNHYLPPSCRLRPGRTASASAGKADFQQALQAAATRQQAAPAELAAALRLRMLQQAMLLGADGETDESPLPSPLDLISLLSKNYPTERQNIDLPTATATPPPADAAPLDDLIERAAARYQVDPEFVRAVIRAESGFDPAAVSPAGAQGLMQLMPATARELGVSDPFDPEQNVMAGTRYLRQMLGRYDGDRQKALAAYNWGPGNLDRSDGRLPGETRQYIARIEGLMAKAER